MRKIPSYESTIAFARAEGVAAALGNARYRPAWNAVNSEMQSAARKILVRELRRVLVSERSAGKCVAPYNSLEGSRPRPCRGASGCFGWYRPNSPPPGNVTVARVPHDRSTGAEQGTFFCRSTRIVDSRFLHIRKSWCDPFSSAG